MLEAFRLRVHLVPLVSERFGQVQLQQPVVADDAQGHLLAGGGERHVAVARVPHQPQVVQALDHIGHRGTGQIELLGQSLHRHLTAVALQAVDRLEVVLHGVRDARRIGRRRLRSLLVRGTRPVVHGVHRRRS